MGRNKKRNRPRVDGAVEFRHPFCAGKYYSKLNYFESKLEHFWRAYWDIIVVRKIPWLLAVLFLAKGWRTPRLGDDQDKKGGKILS
jgi:hypothetical protein